MPWGGMSGAEVWSCAQWPRVISSICTVSPPVCPNPSAEEGFLECTQSPVCSGWTRECERDEARPDLRSRATFPTLTTGGKGLEPQSPGFLEHSPSRTILWPMCFCRKSQRKLGAGTEGGEIEKQRGSPVAVCIGGTHRRPRTASWASLL